MKMIEIMMELKEDAASGELSEQASGDAQPHISQPYCDDDDLDDFNCDINNENDDEDDVVTIRPPSPHLFM